MRRPEVELVPHAPPPEDLFGDVADRPYTLWLDSAEPGPGTGRCSFLAIDPFLILSSRRGRVRQVEAGRPADIEGPSFGALERIMKRYRLDPVPELPPFQGGAAGYIGYELAHELERLPSTAGSGPNIPDLDLGVYDLVLAWDHSAGTCWIVSAGWPESGQAADRRARERLEAARRWMSGDAPPPGPAAGSGGGDAKAGPGSSNRPAGSAGLASSFSPEGYRTAVAEAIEYILAGDVFQVNLSQRFELPIREGAPDTYRRLRTRSPAPFGAFFRGSDATILSSSPERFLRCGTDGAVETRPIKGTRPRGADSRADRELADALLRSRKDMAENLMIVDLLRNDLSRVCRPGSIAVPGLFELESYASVHHLVSTVTGRLAEGRGAIDLLAAAFPGGSVTGAPKIRAMEIIAELEPVPRGPYCGAIGYVSFDGGMDTNIAIRTIVQTEGRSLFHAGGAVVADSDPAGELAETLDKAAGMAAALGLEASDLRDVVRRTETGA